MMLSFLAIEVHIDRGLSEHPAKFIYIKYIPLTYTTGFSFFAECLSHSAKADIHSAKGACRVHFIGHSAKALPSDNLTLGKEKLP